MNEDQIDNIFIGLRKIIRAVNIESKKIEKEFGISIPQLLTLKFLSNQENFISSVTSLKDYLSLNASTVSGIIKRLEIKGLVAKLPKTNDKRTNPIILTENGNIIVKKSSKSLHEIFLIEIKDISDEKFNKLISSIELINSILNTEKIDAAPIFTGKVE